MGYTSFFLPLLLIFMAVEIFRSDENKLPNVIIFATFLMVLWFSGLFGLMKLQNGEFAGGFIGSLINKATLSMVNSAVAALIYIVLIFITSLFVLRLSPIAVIKRVGEALKTDEFKDNEKNVSVMRKAADTPAATNNKKTKNEFNIDVEMEGANIGPKVTQYTLRPPSGVKLTRITALETNIALNLAAQSLRIEAPIPGKRAVGIEVPNLKAADVRLYGVLDSKEWKKSAEPLSFAVGKDISGDAVVCELNKMPHLLIAGQTGSGKSVMINALLTSLLYRNSPSEMKLILVDPKQVEMAPYEDIPHLLTPIINDPEKTISALKWAVNEMERRYKLLAENKIREIKSYNKMFWG
jgi:S-DNA-T family DNA segregation ATPase FtsK/SpoIIIE